MQPTAVPGADVMSTYPEDPFRTGYMPHTRDSAFQVGSGDIELALIVDVIPHARCYRLQTSTRATARGYTLSNTSHNTASGTNDISTYQVDTPVLVYFPMKDTARGFILGAVPAFVWDGNLALPPVLVPGSDVGITEPLFQHMIKGEDFEGQGLGIENFSGGAPADNLPGDWGVMNELGTGLLVSKTLATMRAADNCSLSVFYFDQLLRIHAYNYEQFTASSEHRVYNDEQEVHDVQLRCKFPWEGLGVTEHGVNPFEKAEGEWKPGERKAYYEPMSEDQTGIWRDVELRGYLGDLHRQVVTIPDFGYESQPITYKDNAKPAYAGVSEITRGANGSIGIRSAKEIILAKTVLIPVPHQKTLPDDNVEGDWRKTYKASNVVGEGTKVDDMADFKWEEDEADIRPALLLDYMAWVFNFNKWENLLAHKKDWFVNEESEQIEKWTAERSYIESSKVTVLKDQYWADMPKQLDIDIDSRVVGQKYYESQSAIAMMDDGSIVIEDGWGSTITMTRGNIQFACAGDIFNRPGRSFYAFAPKDAMLRAGGSIDLTATTHDVRIKAERNLQMLAGNDGENSSKRGGILLESRSSGMELNFDEAGEKVVSGGIVFKAKNSDIVGWGNNIYLGTKKMDTRAAGEIMISADEGKKNILLQADVMMRDIGTIAVDRFGPDRANFYMEAATVIDTGQLIVRGNGAFTKGGQLTVGGSVSIVGGLIAEGGGAFGGSLSDGASDPHMLAGNDGAPQGQVAPAVSQIDQVAQQVETSVAGIVEATDKNFQDGKEKIGSTEAAKAVNFSLRTDDDYEARDFKVFAARWQQLLSEGGGNNVWEEREVTAGTVTTYPYPGRLAYEDGQAFVPEVIKKYYPLGDGRAIDRGEDGGEYKERTHAQQSIAQSLNMYNTTVNVE